MGFVLSCPLAWFRFLELRCNYNSGGTYKYYIKDITKAFPFNITKVNIKGVKRIWK